MKVWKKGAIIGGAWGLASPVFIYCCEKQVLSFLGGIGISTDALFIFSVPMFLSFMLTRSFWIFRSINSFGLNSIFVLNTFISTFILALIGSITGVLIEKLLVMEKRRELTVINKKSIYAGIAAGFILWAFFTVVSIVVFLFAHMMGVGYTGKIIEYRGLLLSASGGIVFGILYDYLPGKRSTSKGIVFVLVFSLIPISYVIFSFGFVWTVVQFLFILVYAGANSVIVGALLGLSFELAIKRVDGGSDK